MEEDLLDSLLAVASEQLDDLEGCNKSAVVEDNLKPPKRTLQETDVFHFDSQVKFNQCPKNKINSVIHNGDTDSSDDEGNRNYEDQKYNEYGREIKKLINDNAVNDVISSSHYGVPKKRVSTWINNPNPKPTLFGTTPKSKTIAEDVFLDPIFSMRIKNPKISSSVLMERMQGRIPVRFADIAKQLFAGNLKEKDWVICGVLVSKSPPKTSQKGSQYSIWTLSDLKDDIKTVGLFMFGNAYQDLGKTIVGTVIGVLNPGIMEKRDGCRDEASFSIDTAQKVMIFGQSKDFGICKSMKKNGEKCTAIVNLSQCEYCIYHIKQEYQKCSKRSELQANFAGKGLVNLRNKVLGKNEVFYAGKSYTAIPAKKSKKLESRDNDILLHLSKMNGDSKNITKAKNIRSKNKKGLARHLDINPAQRAKDLELLRKLGGATNLENKNNFSGVRSDGISLEESKATALSVIEKLKSKSLIKEKKTSSQYSEMNLKGVDVEKKGILSGDAPEKDMLKQNKNTALSAISGSEEEQYVNDLEFDLQYDELTSDSDDNPISTNINRVKEDIVATISKPLSTMKDNSNRRKLCNSTKPNLSDCLKEDKLPVDASPNLKEVFPSHLEKLPPLKNQNAISSRNSPNSLDMMTLDKPILSSFGTRGVIDLNKPITLRHIDRAKINALKYVQQNGPLKKIDPNSTRSSGVKKRNFDDLFSNGTSENANNTSGKKSKLQESEFISDRFKKMMAMTSKHVDLLERYDNEEKDKYFNKLEAKEKMEDKMANTHKVKCRAVRCLQCKYTSFSASDLCKTQRHTLKVFDAMKRFYKCSNCQNRTVILELIPTRPCKNCGSSKWEKTGMMKEKIAVVQHNLSIRGGEQKFVNSVATDANLDLMVPDD